MKLLRKLPLLVALLGVVLVLSLQFATPSPFELVWRGREHGVNVIGPVLLAADHTAPIMQVCISVIVLSASLWIVLSQRYQNVEKHWAYGAIGTIIGFWLKG